MMKADLAALKAKGSLNEPWSCGNTKRIKPEDRVFLLRQSVEPRGILASGQAKSLPYYEAHWDKDQNGKALYVDVRWDALVDPEVDGVLPIAQLRNGPLGKVNWSTQRSGISIAPLAASFLEELWRAFLETRGQSPAVASEEVSTPELYFEGATRTISVNAYERDPRARKACIEHYGETCFVCGFDFAATYGDLGKGSIHVHHVVPLSKIWKSYVVDPVRDLRPVCPNCHAMLHRRADVLPVEELQRIVRN